MLLGSCFLQALVGLFHAEGQGLPLETLWNRDYKANILLYFLHIAYWCVYSTYLGFEGEPKEEKLFDSGKRVATAGKPRLLPRVVPALCTRWAHGLTCPVPEPRIESNPAHWLQSHVPDQTQSMKSGTTHWVWSCTPALELRNGSEPTCCCQGCVRAWDCALSPKLHAGSRAAFSRSDLGCCCWDWALSPKLHAGSRATYQD